MLFFAPIVEGHGEVEALPALLHRIAEAAGYRGQLIVNTPWRVKSGSFLNDRNYFFKQVSLVADKAKGRNGVVLVMLDSDDDRHCPATLGPDLLQRVLGIRADVPVLVSLAWREYETWFLTAARSLSGHAGLPASLEPPPTPDGIRGAKEWLGQRMSDQYDPITPQLDFTKLFDLEQARANRSFDRLYRRVEDLLKNRASAQATC